MTIIASQNLPLISKKYQETRLLFRDQLNNGFHLSSEAEHTHIP